MRVVSVPGRTVRHWVTGRVIDDAGIAYDPHCVTTAHYLGHGDLQLVDRDPDGPLADAPAPAIEHDAAE
ncbi:MAG: hypothetical protein P4L68_08225 [Methylovirgula sp.]|nr:hypothetical protein [Methylovirgula sp.]